MCKVKFYLLHGWLMVKKNNGTVKYFYQSIPVNELSEDLIYAFEDSNFKIDNIEVIYNYDENEGDSND